MQTLNQWVETFLDVVNKLEVEDGHGRPIPSETGFHLLFRKALQTKRMGSLIFLAGNGASSSMASHAAADLAKNGHLRTMAFTDPSLLTAVGNDIGYKEVFAEPLRRLANTGDMLVVISSSGRSPNILRATQMAGEMGVDVVTFSAMRPDNPLRKAGSLNFYVPAPSYGCAESAHAALLHYWIDLHVAAIEEHSFQSPADPQMRLAVVL